MTFGIKRGATLLFAIQFTETEWARIAPITEARAYARVAGTRHQLTTTVDTAQRALLLRAETAGWATGQAELDASLVYGGKTAAVPELSNITFPVIQGVAL